VNRKIYFYLEGNKWRVSGSLPGGIRLGYEDYVTIEMDSDRPYTLIEEHKRKYPPGQMKKNKKGKWSKK